MAEFQEVCRQALRMAKTMNAEIDYSRDYVGLYITTDGEVPAEHGLVAVTPEKIERDIMEWAAAHPEPRYPSWDDVWKQLFPDAQHPDAPCLKYMLPNSHPQVCSVSCRDCTKRPIPTDIAEKLGIKPLEEQKCTN